MPRGQVDAVPDGRVGVDGGDQEGLAGEELVLHVLAPGLGVVGVLEHQRADGADARTVGPGGVGVLVGQKPFPQQEPAAVGRQERFPVPPGPLVADGPAVHGHAGGQERLPGQVPQVGLGAALEDAVDVAGGVGLTRHRGPGVGGDLPADRLPVALLVAAPVDAAALATGPPLGQPDEAPDVASLSRRLSALHPGVGVVAGGERRPVARPDPADVELAHPHPGPDLGAVGPEPGRRPQAELHVPGVEPGGHLVEELVAAAVAVVDQHPAQRDLVLAVFVGDLQGVERVDLTVAGAVEVTVGVPHLQAVDGRHERAAGQLGVPVDHVLQVADEVVGVEAGLLVAGQQRSGERVRPRRQSVAEDAVAGGRDVERHRVGVAPVVPVVADGHLDGLVPVGEAAVLHAPAEELLVGAAAEHLRRLATVPGGADELLPDHRPVVGPVEGEAQVGLVDPQGQRAGGQEVVGAGVGDPGVTPG